jgi:dCMP deaminase
MSMEDATLALRHIEYLRMAYQAAAHESDDLDTQNGAILVDASGRFIASAANHVVSGLEKTNERLKRPAKYTYMVHAERAAIYKAASIGRSVAGGTLYCPWAACASCAQAVIESGISLIVNHHQVIERTPERWREELQVAEDMLKEAGVEIHTVSSLVGGVSLRFDGKEWNP